MLEGASVLVVDDEKIMHEVLGSLLSREGCHVHLAATGEEGIRLIKTETIDVVLLDVMMPKMNGLEVLKEVKGIDDVMPVIMITAFGTSSNTRDALMGGAFNFIEKPFRNDEVLTIVRNAVDQRRLESENRVLRENLRTQSSSFGDIIGKSPGIRQVFELVTQAAPSRATILVTGESGTGKELVARAIHDISPRVNQPFVTVNSGSLPPDLLESNLFGHVRGAFTGAVAPKKGLFEMANKGSIFFDEIGTVPRETQAKLLRVIQEREFMRLGGVDNIKVDVRIIAATNVDLLRMVDEGTFREDLYYRLQVITIDLPPLRERREDVLYLARSFLRKYAKENDKTDLKLTPEALHLLENCRWPGNVRELENVIERAVVLTGTSSIGVDLVPDSVKTAQVLQLPNFDVPSAGIPFRKIIEEIEGLLIVRALNVSGGVQKRAAGLLQIKPTTLNEMIKRYGIRVRRRRNEDAMTGSRGRAASRDVVKARASTGRRMSLSATSSDIVNAIDKRLPIID